MSASRVRRALISVYDKQGILELASALQALGIELVSSGGTARLLEEGGVPVRRVAEITGFPEMLGGRVKTLHPRIHGGILAARSDPSHMQDLERAEIPPIDLVVVNLYPFEAAAASAERTPAEVIELIDIGGPAMVRAAAKNHAHVGVVVDPADYPAVLAELREHGGLSDALRRRLAATAFARTSAYDAAIEAWLAPATGTGLPVRLRLDLPKIRDLRYGENPHQQAALYADPAEGDPALAGALQLQGKELSFNNLLDLDAALGLVADLGASACAIVKHGNPCGAALAPLAADAFRLALACDPVSAFGGIVAFGHALDGTAAEALAEIFFECVIAPSIAPAAREILSRKKNLRLIECGEPTPGARGGLDLRRVRGGLLAQERDELGPPVREGQVPTRRQPTESEWRALQFAWIVAKHVKSNAIVYALEDRTVGIGAGQMSRVDSARFGILKARAPVRGTVLASDAFFPFRDGLDAAAEAGVRAVVQPGGSVRDAEVVAAADEHGMAMVFTARRHFRH